MLSVSTDVGVWVLSGLILQCSLAVKTFLLLRTAMTVLLNKPDVFIKEIYSECKLRN